MSVERVRVEPDGTVTVRCGKVELGQGILTALAQIAAEELDVDLGRIRMVAASTDVSPDEGFTAGSQSVEVSGTAVRQACADLRAVYVAAARSVLGEGELRVNDGRIVAPDGRAVAYQDLEPETSREVAQPKAPADYRVVGTSAPRIDLPDKVTGRARFLHDLRMPGLLHGRVVRPPSPGAALTTVDTTLPGVEAVVRDGRFLGVVAIREEAAIRAADELRTRAVWRDTPTLPDEDALAAYVVDAPADEEVLAETGVPPAAGGHDTVAATYSRPYLAHASLGPACAVAVVHDGRWTVWSHTQGIHPLRRELARALDASPDQFVVHHVEGAGCYGHNGADDVALDAVLLARAVPGRPVRVLWSRQDEMTWSPFGPGAVVRVEADLDAAGHVAYWRHHIWGSGHAGRPGGTKEVALLAAAHLGDGAPEPVAVDVPIASGGAAGRNAVPPYAFPGVRVVNHQLRRPPLRTSSLRSLGAHLNVFAAESFMDELALRAGVDPVVYRLRQLTDPRARAVVEAAVARAGQGLGQGVAFARYKNTGAYCAVVAEITTTPALRVRRLTVAVDVGLVVNPDGVVNQIEGGAVQATSWTMVERVRFDRFRVTSDTYRSYPVLRFSEVPEVEVVVLNRPDEPSVGAGEAAQGPVAAAIGNAIGAATGVRVRDLPLSRGGVHLPPT